MPGIRIVEITPHLAPHVGGVETHVREVSRRMRDYGIACEIWTADPTHNLPAEDELEGVPVKRWPARPRNRDVMLVSGLARELAVRRFDVVHVQSYHTLLAPLAMAGALQARIPYVVTFHAGGYSSAWRMRARWPHLLALRPLLRRAAALVTIARFEVEFYGRLLGVGPEKFVSIPNGADLPRVASSSARGPGMLIVSPGRLERYKGHQRAVEALSFLRRSHPDARLLIAGAGPYEAELRATVSRLGLDEAVQIRSLTRDEMAEVLSGAAVAVLLSEWETQPIAAFEALALKVPLVVARNSGMTELADDGMAVGVNLQDGPREWAAAIQAAISNGPSAGSIDVLTWDDTAARLATLYESVGRR